MSAPRKPKPKSKTAHAVEAWEADVIAHAVSWSAFQFRGPGDRQKAETASREEAVAIARIMLADNSRPVMIYAINAEGRQALATTINHGDL